MRRMLIALPILLVALSGLPLRAWETATDGDGNWRSMYLLNGTKLQTSPGPSGFHDNEHAELADIALQELGLSDYSMQGKSITIVDLNASLFRPDLRERENLIDGLEGRTVPPPAHFAGIPDFSWSIYDWINKNTLCPALPVGTPDYDNCYGYFPGWLSALNSSHFGSQAEKNYRRLHRLALWLAARARDMRERLEKDPNDLKIHAAFVREAELMALYYEGAAQHFLQDRWSIGHMWERWGTANYNEIGYRDVWTNVAIGAISGLIHGPKSVIRMLPPEVNEKELLLLKAAPMCSPMISKDKTQAVPMLWRYRTGSDVTPRPGVGDHRLSDIYRGFFGIDYPAIGRDYELNVRTQRDTMVRCMKAGWVEVVQAFGQSNTGGFGINGLKPKSDNTSFDGCFDMWATNEAIYNGWNNNAILNYAEIARQVLKLKNPMGTKIVEDYFDAATNNLRADVDRLRWHIERAYHEDRYGIGLATGGIDNIGLAKPGSASGEAAYLEPIDLSSLPRVDNKGLDKNTIWGFFNRAGTDYWCELIGQAELLASLRGSEDPIKRTACYYLVDRASRGTDPRYEGKQRWVRTLDDKPNSPRVNPICWYYGLNTDRYDENVPVYLHPGYVGYIPSQRSVRNWCDKVPVINLITEPGSEKLSKEDLVADVILEPETGGGAYKEITVTGYNFGNEAGQLWLAPRAEKNVPLEILRWTDTEIHFRIPWSPQIRVGKNPFLFVMTKQGKNSVGRFVMRLRKPEETELGLGGGPDCDCENLNFGILTREYQLECKKREAALKELAKQGKLNLKVGPDKKLMSGEFCSQSGPAAWPVHGGPPAPPSRDQKRKKPCLEVSGIMRKCK